MKILAIDDNSDFLRLLSKEVKIVSTILNTDIILVNYTDVNLIDFSNSFDICFLDIEMPGKSGFEISAEYDEKQMKIVFITAIENYVFHSFENHAYDFIRKSTLHDDLIRVISRYLREDYPLLSIPYSGRIIHINSNDIVSIRMMRNELTISFSDKCLTIRKTLKSFLKEYSLDTSEKIIQINRSELINLDKIRFVEKNEIVLNNGAHLFITKKYMEEFLKKYYTNSKRE